MCDNSVLRGAETRGVIEPEVVPSPFSMGDRVVHERLGEGTVQRLENDRVTVLFDESGYKTLALELVQEQGLLEPKPE